MSERRNPVRTLRAMPDVFDLSTFGRLLDMERQYARIYASRWMKAGLLGSAGPRAGIYFNLVTAPDGATRLANAALRLEYPSAIACGAGVLHSTGWITQIPRRTDVAVLGRDTYVSFDGFDIHGRPRSWYQAVRSGLVNVDAPADIPSLTPAFALADIFANRDLWRPDPDDLDVPEEDQPEVVRAFAALDVETPDWLADWACPVRQATSP